MEVAWSVVNNRLFCQERGVAAPHNHMSHWLAWEDAHDGERVREELSLVGGDVLDVEEV